MGEGGRYPLVVDFSPQIRRYLKGGSNNPKSGVVYYLHGDHLGSTSLTTDQYGQPVSQARYLPYGEELWREGSSRTDFGYTGQRRDGYMDLIDYGARWYDPYLGRFVSPDTVVPDYTVPQSLNRYSYTFNNPLKHIDPSGHEPCRTGSWGDCIPGFVPGRWTCEDTLANCFNGGDPELKKFEDYEDVDPNELKDLSVAIKEDLETQDTSRWSDVIHGANLLATRRRRYSGGRYSYDTPLWNGYQFDAKICLDGQGCWSRSNMNYIAQGMWGAAAGASLEDTLEAPQQWNETMYGHPAEEGELYWTEYGWKMWWILEQEGTPETLPEFEMETEQ